MQHPKNLNSSTLLALTAAWGVGQKVAAQIVLLPADANLQLDTPQSSHSHLHSLVLP